MTTKESIFNKALILFSKQGYDVTTIRAIVGKVGIKESSFYNHYSSKKELLNDIFKECNDFYLRENPSIDERKKLLKQCNMQEVLYTMLSLYFKMWKKPHALQLWRVVNSEQYRSPEAREIVLNEKKRRIERANAIFEMMQQQGKMKPCNSYEVASLYVNAMRALHNDYVTSKLNNIDTKPFIEAMYKTIDTLVDSFQYSSAEK